MTDLVQRFLLARKGSLAATQQAQQQSCSLTDLGQCLLLESGSHCAEVLLVNVAGRFDGASQHAPAQRAVCSHQVQATQDEKGCLPE